MAAVGEGDLPDGPIAQMKILKYKVRFIFVIVANTVVY
jgi:hypothetical protein